MVVLAENGVARNGEPDTLDLYRSPSSTMVVLVIGLLIGLFYSGRLKSRGSEAFAQVANDGAGIGEPSHTAIGFGNAQAGDFGSARAL